MSIIKLNEVSKPTNTSWDCLGALLGPSWRHLRPAQTHIVPSWDHFWAILAPSWTYPPSWGHLGALLGPAGAHIDPSWDHLGSVLAPSWDDLGALLGPSWRPLWTHHSASWAILAPSGASLEHLGTMSSQETEIAKKAHDEFLSCEVHPKKVM